MGKDCASARAARSPSGGAAYDGASDDALFERAADLVDGLAEPSDKEDWEDD